jgi:hypothetical protein
MAKSDAQQADPAAQATATALARASQAHDAQAPAAEPEVKLPELSLNDLRLWEGNSAAWRWIVPRGVTPEDLEREDLTQKASTQVKWLDLVRVVCKDSSWWGEYLVASVGVGLCQLKLLRSVGLPPQQRDGELRVPSWCTIRKAEPGETPWDDNWVVQRKSDGRVLNPSERVPTFRAAVEYAEKHPAMRPERYSVPLP